MFGAPFSQFSVFQLFPFSPLYLMFCGAYVFNRRHYSYSLFSAVNTYTYSYRLRGRELWLTASLTR